MEDAMAKAVKVTKTAKHAKKAVKETHVVLRGSKRGKDPNAVQIGKIDPSEEIVVTIGLAGPKLPSADEAVGQTLSPEEFAQRYGASQEDADRVAASLKKFGLKVENVSLVARTMKVSGTAKAMEAAFRPGMVLMRSAKDGDYRGRTGTLEIPAELKGIVTGVFGLDTRRMARRKAKSPAAGTRTATLSPLTPADLEQRYNFPPGNAKDQRIAIAEFGGGYFAADAQAYCAKFGRATPNIVATAVDAPAYTWQQVIALPPSQRGQVLDDSVEVMMDVQIVAGLCSGANITIYFSTFDQQGWVDLLSAVLASPPVALSCSWGLAEEDPGWSSNAITAIDDRLNALRLLGVTTCISSGDDGSGDQINDGKAHVDFPSSSPNALSVGGTMLTGSGNSIDEVTWWQKPGQRAGHGGATGGGVSMLFPRPKWQGVRIKSLNQGAIDGRVTPDLAALSGPPFYDLIFASKDAPNGGTSASAPLLTALIARICGSLPANKQRRFLTPLLYQRLSNNTVLGKVAMRDIKTGNNASFPEPGKGYKAGAGFDATTGWGVPDGAKLLNGLSAI
jgi:kumamolisin